MLAGTVGALVIVVNLLRFAEARQWFDSMVLTGIAGGFVEILVLFSSAVMVLTIYEGFAGWREADSTERRMRLFFVGVIASCIAVTTTVAGLAAGWPWLAELQRTFEAIAAAVVILSTNLLIFWHGRVDWNAGKGGDCPDNITCPVVYETEDQLFAQSVEKIVRRQQLYLQADLKVAAVASALDVPEYRVSRAICGPLGHTNFNQFINRYRIDYACELLLARVEWPVLTVALESGFASIGPFNRAFKQQLGMTPTSYRSSRSGEKVSRAVVG